MGWNTKLLHTGAVRLSLRYALFYALLIGMALSLLYWTTSHYVNGQLISGLDYEMKNLKKLEHKRGRDVLRKVIEARSHNVEKNKAYYLLLSQAGVRLAGNLHAWPHGFRADGKVRNVWVEGELITGHAEHPGSPDLDAYWPMIGMRMADGGRLLIAHSVRGAEDMQEYALLMMGLILAGSIILALTMGLFLGRAVLQRINAISSTAGAIMGGDLSRRIPITDRNDEFDELASRLNAMLDRIDQLMTGLRQVSDNVAHDLRRPLSRLQNRLEVTLLDPRSPEEYRDTLRETLNDANELLFTFNALLEIAQAETGGYCGEKGVFDLSELAESMGGLYQDQADTQDLNLLLDIESGITLAGNRHLISEALSNLLENAMKYTPAGGNIDLMLHRRQNDICLAVCDNGPGIPASQRGKVLERFVRLDSARSTSGNGLGLSLVKAVANFHGARLLLMDNQPGLRVEMLFPSPVGSWAESLAC